MSLMQGKYRAGILGATGAVGQRFIQLLEGHPWITVTILGASSKNEGKEYSSAVNWKVSSDMPEYVKKLIIYDCSKVDDFINLVDMVFSGLDSSVAGDIESEFASKGIAVFTNAKNFRMHPNVPILIPYVNPNHIDMVEHQKWYQNSGGFIVANANCSSTGLVVALKPLHDAMKIETCIVSTLQAVSGAGYPGLPSIDLIDNIIPYISGEEEKIETEPNKILGNSLPNGTVEFASIQTTAMCHRVNVSDGHTISVSLSFVNINDGDEILNSESTYDSETRPSDYDETSKLILSKVNSIFQNFKPTKEVQQLPSCPTNIIVIRAEDDRPQPKVDRTEGNGFSITVGRIRNCSVHHVKFVVLSHNTILGAAGGSILNAELALTRGLVTKRQ